MTPSAADLFTADAAMSTILETSTIRQERTNRVPTILKHSLVNVLCLFKNENDLLASEFKFTSHFTASEFYGFVNKMIVLKISVTSMNH